MATPLDLERAIPDVVHGLLRTLWAGGHAAYVVGGSLRDTLLGRAAKDWDLATAALPERTLELFPGAVYENKFGTVAVRTGDAGRRRGRDHDLPLRPRLRRLPSAASGRVQRLHRAGPGEA